MDRITSLITEARTASDDQQPDMAGAINELMARLPAEATSEETAVWLLRLLDDGHLDGLRDEAGQPSSVAATRALLGLGYPHAMQVPPERLEALRRWERRTLPVPWGPLVGTLLLAAMMQCFFVLMSDQPRQLFGVSAECLAGEVPCPPAGLSAWFRYEGQYLVSTGLFLENVLAGVAAVTVGRLQKVRPRVRLGFLGVGVLGLLTWGALLALGYAGVGWGAFMSAAGALAAWRILKVP
ncbi:hypothetical protein [Myxococcus sp. RHSTA-1-4]|uniref:hypothetical protein n=1 Tax=Myxococcus sp. RHSTA-1-4 TaxID=2874601 RepID=UPI001CBDC101|nr:hypothetical protein [Myxococcus sp. RHSTA-1-4]MBZ4417311.1 hypothetical protein [Myxococcus sp. RHSTA-1-4]